MEKTSTNGLYISQNDVFALENVTSLNVANYSDVALFVTLDDVTETLLPYDNTIAPDAFQVKGDGSYSDMKLKLEFDSRGSTLKSGNAVLRYRKVITNQNC